MSRQPTIGRREAEEICAKPWPTIAEAEQQAEMLEKAGWTAIRGRVRRPDGTTVVARIYHPRSGWSPGDVVAAAGAPDIQHDPGG